MKKVVIGSVNPVKLEAVRAGFISMFPGETFEFQQITVPSGVRDQPMSDAETLQGAGSRAKSVRLQTPDADYWVGVEGGVDVLPNGSEAMITFAWVVVLSRDLTGWARSGIFQLPARVAALVRAGVELGDADDRVFGTSNSKQNNGAVGLLTGNTLSRTAFYTQAVQLALIPFKNSEMYRQENVAGPGE
ncbi:MAG: inosine/xanthosine triphosphatase [Anaerolineaceae bacterium]